MVTENLSFTERLKENIASKPKGKSENPLKNAKSLVAMFEKIFLVLTTVDSKKVSNWCSQCVTISDCYSALVLWILDNRLRARRSFL